MEKATGVIRIEHLEDFAQVFQETYNTGDLDGLISLFEPEAVLVPGPSQVATGTDAIREGLAGFLAASDCRLPNGRWKTTILTAVRGRLALALCTSFAGRRMDRGISCDRVGRAEPMTCSDTSDNLA